MKPLVVAILSLITLTAMLPIRDKEVLFVDTLYDKQNKSVDTPLHFLRLAGLLTHTLQKPSHKPLRQDKVRFRLPLTSRPPCRDLALWIML